MRFAKTARGSRQNEGWIQSSFRLREARRELQAGCEDSQNSDSQHVRLDIAGSNPAARSTKSRIPLIKILRPDLGVRARYLRAAVAASFCYRGFQQPAFSNSAWFTRILRSVASVLTVIRRSHRDNILGMNHGLAHDISLFRTNVVPRLQRLEREVVSAKLGPALGELSAAMRVAVDEGLAAAGALQSRLQP